jgi:hypothetical protein
MEAHQLLFGKIACFAMSDFGGAHAAFRLMITCVVRRYGLLLRTLPLISADRRSHLGVAHMAARTALQLSESWAFLRTYKRSIN